MLTGQLTRHLRQVSQISTNETATIILVIIAVLAIGEYPIFLRFKENLLFANSCRVDRCVKRASNLIL
jgi:hypothetical protein